ncbi:MAG: hypothetical protein ABSH06_10070 [Thermodesulfobacteriota bacterium]|jgi:hypothetical protein
MGELNLKYSEGDGKHPHVSQFYLCRAWLLESALKPIEVPDQAGYVRKLACSDCLGAIQGAEKKQGSCNPIASEDHSRLLKRPMAGRRKR